MEARQVRHPCESIFNFLLACRSIKDEITLDKLAPARIVVFAAPRDKFTSAEARPALPKPHITPRTV